MCCGKTMTAYVPSGYDYKEIEVKCGNTQMSGDPYLCDECKVKLAHVDWRAQAAECGESYGDDLDGYFD